MHARRNVMFEKMLIREMVEMSSVLKSMDEKLGRLLRNYAKA